VAPQYGNNLGDDSITLCVGQPTEPLAEHVYGQPHHPVGEYDKGKSWR
jgi:hypothetical protein